MEDDTMRIQNNITAMNAHRQYTVNNDNKAKAAQKLSSGYRINSAGDDAAGLAISEKMRAQIRGLDTASKNSQDAISLVQTAEGALQETHSMLQRMNELAVQSSTGTSEDFDRAASNAEFVQLNKEIDDIASQTTFNNMKLLDGSLGGGKLLVDVKNAATTLSAGDAVGTLSFNNHFGLSATKEGTYTLSEGTVAANGTFTAGAGGTHIQATFTDNDGNVTNTVMKFADIYSSSGNANEGFSLDLSDAGLGKFQGILTGATTAAAALTSLDGATTEVRSFYTDAAAGATAVTGVAAGATLSGVVAKGVFTISSSGSDLIFKNASGDTLKTVTVAGAGMGVGAAGAFQIDLTDVGLGKIDYPSLAGSTAAGIVGDLDNFAKITSGGSAGGELKVQVGALEGEQLSISIGAMDSAGLGVKSLSIADQDSAGKAITATRNAINTVSDQRALLGATSNRLEHRINNLNVSSENAASAESRIRDVDMAKEMTNFTKQGILSSAATAMLAQANSAPQQVLQLLQG